MRTPPADLGRYDRFGWDYELFNPLSEAEGAWYELWARRAEGPLLGLACGSGRLQCRLARAGFEVVGLDLSDEMLAMARRHAARLPAGARRRLSFVEGNMAAFDLGRRFGLVFIADNSFRELRTRRDLLRCLRCIRRHLLPGGRVLISERRFEASAFPGGRRSFRWSEPLRHPHTGERVRRGGEARLSRDHKRIRGKFIYRTTHADGSETIEECEWGWGPVLRKPEYLALFARAGLAARVYSGYREVEDDGKELALCFVCEAQG